MYQRILYSSRAAAGTQLRDVFDVIRVSHNRNSNAGLTGGLLFLDGYFFQVLEGLPYALADRYKRIANDPRHHSLMLRSDEATDRLLFPSDWMALRDGASIDRDILTRHGYVVGLPADRFDADKLLSFLLDCFQQSGVATESLVGSAV